MSWRDPPTIISIENASDFLVDAGDGRIMADVEVVVDQATTDRYREGRLCLNCLWEPFEVPFPDRCPACGYEVNRYQLEHFGGRYKGEGKIGPRWTVDEEIARMEEHLDYERRHDIVLPDSVKFPNGEIL